MKSNRKLKLRNWESSRLGWHQQVHNKSKFSQSHGWPRRERFFPKDNSLHWHYSYLRSSRFPLRFRHCDWNNKLLIASYYNFFIFHSSLPVSPLIVIARAALNNFVLFLHLPGDSLELIYDGFFSAPSSATASNEEWPPRSVSRMRLKKLIILLSGRNIVFTRESFRCIQ